MMAGEGGALMLARLVLAGEVVVLVLPHPDIAILARPDVDVIDRLLRTDSAL